MSVYIELVIFNNFCMDLLLEMCALCARRRKPSKLRCVIAAAFGAIVATLSPLAPSAWQTVVKILLAPAMTVVFFKPKSGRPAARFADILATAFVFVTFTFLAGGVVYASSYLFKTDVRSHAALGLAALGGVICLLCAKAAAYRRSSSRAENKTVQLCVDGKSIDCKALCDSGNLLADPLTGLPVVIISKEIASRLGDRPAEGTIEVSTVNGGGSLPLVKLDYVQVDGAARPAYGAISASLEGCDVVLQATMF